MGLNNFLKNKMNKAEDKFQDTAIASELESETSVSQMKSIMDKEFTTEKFKTFVQNKREIEKSKGIQLETTPPDYYFDMDKQQIEMLSSMKQTRPFITDELTKFVPFYYPNLILIGAKTGYGKTTATSNISYQLFKNKRKTLIITNEELNINVFNRIACIDIGISPSSIDRLNAHELQELSNKRKEIGEFVRVVDIAYDQNPTLTSSVEGIEAILESVYLNGNSFDCIIIDYYQNISFSKKNPFKKKHEVLSDLKSLLDKYYKLIKAPIVVFAQLHPESSERSSFEDRIKEGKSIVMASTFVVELDVIREENATEWTCHKDRNGTGSINKTVKTKYQYGKYLDLPKNDVLAEILGTEKGGL